MRVVYFEMDGVHSFQEQSAMSARVSQLVEKLLDLDLTSFHPSIFGYLSNYTEK